MRAYVIHLQTRLDLCCSLLKCAILCLLFQVDKAHPDVLTVMLQLFDEVTFEPWGTGRGKVKWARAIPPV